MLGIQGQGGSKGRFRLGNIFHHQESVPNFRVNVGVPRILFKGLLVIIDGAARVAQSQVGFAQHHVNAHQGLGLAVLQSVGETPAGDIRHLVHVGEITRKIIPDAVVFVRLLKAKRPRVVRGILSGNARKIAQWKLSHTGLLKYFSFGLYGDEADDRIELAGQVFAKAKLELAMDLKPEEIVVIGDTVFDIRCGKGIGATTIAVTTGMHGSPEELAREKPDYLVNSLMDPTVLSLFSLK